MTESRIIEESAETFTCPRRVEDGRADPNSVFRGSGENLDKWQTLDRPDAPGVINNGRRSCTYCGSMHPDDFMQAVDDGHTIGPTDKSYKAYVRFLGEENERKKNGKFYFQHLTVDQRLAFIGHLNAGTMNIGVPGHFYSKPFFITYKPPPGGTP